jgi:hypothetical protein
MEALCHESFGGVSFIVDQSEFCSGDLKHKFLELIDLLRGGGTPSPKLVYLVTGRFEFVAEIPLNALVYFKVGSSE